MKKITLLSRDLKTWRLIWTLNYLITSHKLTPFYTFSDFWRSGNARTFFVRGCFFLVSQLTSIVGILFSDIVYVAQHENPARFTLWLLNKCKGKIVVDYHGSRYDTQVRSRRLIVPRSKKAERLLELDRMVVLSADVLIVASRSELYYNINTIGLSPGELKAAIKVRGIPAPDYRGDAQTPYLVGMSKELSIGWWGYPAPVHGIEMILDGIALLKEQKIYFHFYMYVGRSVFKNQYSDLIFSRGLGDVVTIDDTYQMADGTLVDQLKEKIDVSLGLFGSDQRTEYVLSNKVVESASLGIPCVSPVNTGVTEFFKDGQSVILTERTPQRLASALSKIVADPERFKHIGEASYKVYLKNCSQPVFLELLDNVFETSEQC